MLPFGLEASGDINPSRFVVVSGPFLVAQSTATGLPIGVSQQGSAEAPIPGASGLAASAGQLVQVYGEGEMCLLSIGGTVAAGQFLRSNANGQGIAVVGQERYAAQALEPGVVGDRIRVFIHDGMTTKPTVAVAAVGSTQANGAALQANSLNTVSAADGTRAVVLPPAYAGAFVEVYNEHATNGLRVFPAVGDDINDGTVDAAITTEGRTLAVFRAIDDTTWTAVFVANT